MHSKFELSAFECSTFYTVEPSSAKERERESETSEKEIDEEIKRVDKRRMLIAQKEELRLNVIGERPESEKPC